ncbi:MAG: DUF2945 domain-containing protein [Novosphingopyxis baekryungensis]|jgi:hypothetical protein|uniref:DUF2945 domain-containing protein n=1 Tax=Novosphingopyxis baekryungensis TaxID=279369 RepID=UPI0003B4A6EE|nr:DUF2945 domain-containing protein [Novosphingopyxis baekryungensis]MDE0933730.1 DUF2945 domain-containing protein [Novosphingopyxis baekryungensis]
MANDNSFQTNQYVEWDWGNGTATGQIEERFEREVKRTIDGSEITRKGDGDNPAYLIKQEDGDKVLKLGSEIRAKKD